MKNLIIYAVFLFLSVSLLYSECNSESGYVNDETGWCYSQSTLQAFYFFMEIQVDGLPVDAGQGTQLGPGDVVGAFKDGVCVGWVYADSPTGGYTENGVTTLLVLGDDGADYTEGYMNTGDVPDIVIYDYSTGATLPLDISLTTNDDGEIWTSYPGWSNFEFSTFHGVANASSGLGGCTDETACNYNPDANVDDGSCWVPECGCTCDDDEGATIDECISYDQSTFQSFYMYESIEIDNEPAEPGLDSGTGPGDYLIAYKNGIVVGATYALESYTTLPLMGNDGSDITSEYMGFGEIPDAVQIVDMTYCSFLDINISNTTWETLDGDSGSGEYPGWNNNEIFILSGTATAGNALGCTDQLACNYDASASADDGSCWFAVDGCSCDDGQDATLDCAGECGGSAVVDECGECGGDGIVQDCGCGSPGEFGIPDGDCDCDGNVLDCNDDCGGSAIFDECGVCDGDGIVQDCGCGSPGEFGIPEGACDCDGNIEDCAGECGGSAEVDDCGVCDGFDASCTGCTDPLADNYNIGCDGDCIVNSGCEYTETVETTTDEDGNVTVDEETTISSGDDAETDIEIEIEADTTISCEGEGCPEEGEDLEITVSEFEEDPDEPINDIPDDFSQSSAIVAFEPFGLTFDDPIDVSISYEQGSRNEYIILFLDDPDGDWGVITGSDCNDGGCSFETNSFGLFTVSEIVSDDQLIFGCTNQDLCGYDPDADYDDGSCYLPDCNDVCDGEAYIDGCGDCVGGDTDLEACPMDCAGAFIDPDDDPDEYASWDLCGVCSGGSSGNIPNNSMDCTGGCTDDGLPYVPDLDDSNEEFTCTADVLIDIDDAGVFTGESPLVPVFLFNPNEVTILELSFTAEISDLFTLIFSDVNNTLCADDGVDCTIFALPGSSEMDVSIDFRGMGGLDDITDIMYDFTYDECMSLGEINPYPPYYLWDDEDAFCFRDYTLNNQYDEPDALFNISGLIDGSSGGIADISIIDGSLEINGFPLDNEGYGEGGSLTILQSDFDIISTARYYADESSIVYGTDITLSGTDYEGIDYTQTQTLQNQVTITFQDITRGDYELTASKDADDYDKSQINSQDATKIAQHLVWGGTLDEEANLITDPDQFISADASNNGILSSVDATRVARFSNEHIDELNDDAVFWKFLSDEGTETIDLPLSDGVYAEGSLEKFSGILLGDVTGNWATTTNNTLVFDGSDYFNGANDRSSSERGSSLLIGSATIAPGGSIELPLELTFEQVPIEGIDLELSLDLDIFNIGPLDINCEGGCFLSNNEYLIEYNISDDCIDTGNNCIKVSIYTAADQLYSESGGLLLHLPIGVSADDQYLNNSYSIFVSKAWINDNQIEDISHGSIAIYLDSSCYIQENDEGATSCNYNANSNGLCDSGEPDCAGLCDGDDGYGDFSCCVFEQVYYQDSDGDGLGDPDISISECAEPPGFVTNNSDPDDNCLSNQFDCQGVCNGLAEIDCNGDCDGGATEICDNSVCCGGNTGLACFDEAECQCEDGSDRDCNGLCESDGDDYGVFNDDCVQCGGSNYFTIGGLGEIECYEWQDNCLLPDGACDCDGSFPDCFGECGGSAIVDECGECGGDNLSCSDCAGIPYGEAELDSCGVCSGGTTGHIADAEQDCFGDCCNGTPNDVEGCGASIDSCGVCSGGNSGQEVSEYVSLDDFSGLYDCTGECSGDAIFDECGVCDGDGFASSCSDPSLEEGYGGCENMDCVGTCHPNTPVGSEDLEVNGASHGAFLDDCGICSGGEVSGHAENQDMDCRGDIGDEDGDGIIDSCFGDYFTDPCANCTNDVTDCGTRVSFENEECQYQGTKLIPLYAEDLSNLESLDLVFEYSIDENAALGQAINVLDDIDSDGTSIDSSEGASLSLIGTQLSDSYALIATENDLEVSLSIYLELPSGTTEEEISDYAVDITSKEPIVYIPVRGLGTVNTRGVGDITILDIKEVFVNDIPVSIPDPDSEDTFNGSVTLTNYFVPKLDDTNVYQTFKFRNNALESALSNWDEIGIYDANGITGSTDIDTGPLLVGSIVWNPEANDSLEFRAVGSVCSGSDCSPGYVKGNPIYINRYNSQSNTESYLSPEYLYCADSLGTGSCEHPSEGTINGIALETYFDFVNNFFDVDQTLHTVTELRNGYFPSSDIIETSQKYTVNLDLNEHLTWLSKGDEIAIYDMFGYTQSMLSCDDLLNRGPVIAGHARWEGESELSIDIYGSDCPSGGLIPGFADSHPLFPVVWNADAFDAVEAELQFGISISEPIPTSPSINNFFSIGQEASTISNSSPDDQSLTDGYGYFGIPSLIFPDPIADSDQRMRFSFSQSLESSDIELESGDEIAIYDNAGIQLCDTTSTLITGPLLVGSGTYNQSLGLNIDIAGGVDYCSSNGIALPGYAENNSVTIRIWDKSEDTDVAILNSLIFDGIDKSITSLDIDSLSIDDRFLPNSIGVSKIYPNPFNPVTNIDFTVPSFQHVKLSVFDVSGSQISVLNDNTLAPGSHSITWDANRFSSGIYFIRFESLGYQAVHKIMLIK